MNAIASDIPDHFQVVHLERAPEPGQPAGSGHDRYTLLLPLGPDDGIIEAQARRHPGYCRVSRTGPGDGVVHGLMRPGPNRNWRFDFGEAEESGLRFAEARFSPGEHVTIVRGGSPQAYRVISRQTV